MKSDGCHMCKPTYQGDSLHNMLSILPQHLIMVRLPLTALPFIVSP